MEEILSGDMERWHREILRVAQQVLLPTARSRIEKLTEEVEGARQLSSGRAGRW